jgi:hypothetical protein
MVMMLEHPVVAPPLNPWGLLMGPPRERCSMTVGRVTQGSEADPGDCWAVPCFTLLRIKSNSKLFLSVLFCSGSFRRAESLTRA